MILDKQVSIKQYSIILGFGPDIPITITAAFLTKPPIANIDFS